MEEGVDQPGEDEPGPQDQGNADDQAAEEGQGVQGGPHLVDVLPPACADLPAHDDGGGVADGEDGHGTEILNVARQGAGGQDLGGPLHVAHDDLVEGGAQAPEGLVEHHRPGVVEKFGQQGAARPEEHGGLEPEAPVGQGVGEHDDELQHAGGQGSHRRAHHAQGGSAQVAEDEHPVEEGVGQHGHAEDDHAQLGVLHGAVGAHVHTGEAVENIGEAHDAGVLSRQGYQLLVVGEKAHQLLRQEEHDGGKGQGDGPRHIAAQADDPVDGLGVPLAPELADEDGGAALESENDQLDDEDGDVGHQHGGQGGFPQGTHHEGVDQPQQGGAQILEQDGQGQPRHVAVEGRPPVHIVEQTLTSLQFWSW